MHNIEASKPQIEASDPAINCWLMASAGSGKTKVLVDRFIRLLLSSVLPQEILCLTFTEKASKEMEKRIFDKLEELAVASEQDLNIKLENILGKKPSLAQVKKAQILFAEMIDCEYPIKIQTFHSFCKTILQLFPIEANIPIHFEIIEANQEEYILQNIWQEVLQDKQNHQLLTAILSKTNKYTLHEIIDSFIKNQDKMKDWQFYGSLTSKKIQQRLQKIFGIDNQNIADFCLSTLQNLDFDQFYQVIEKNSHKKSYHKIFAFLHKNNFTNNLNKQNCQPLHLEELYNLMSTKEETLYKELAKLNEDCIIKFFDELKNFLANKNIFAEINHTTIIVELVYLLMQKYQQYKNQHNLLNFSDLIYYSKELLKKDADWVKMKLDSNINHILLDEAQDTSPWQWEIIKALTEEFEVGESANTKPRSFFVVGDEKQSIYAFQGADINNTSQQFNYFQQKLTLKTINLTHSFRSGQEILQTIDNIFCHNNITSSLVKNTDYNRHLAVKNIKSKFVLLDTMPKPNSENAYQENMKFARKIANDIKNWVENGRTLSNNQAIKYGDILLLFQKKKQAYYLEKAFYEEKILFTSVDKEYCLDSLLINDILALAEFVLNQENDFNLACLLKSPFCNQAEEAIQGFIFASHNAKSSLYAITKNISELQCLNDFLTIFQENNLFDFFYKILKNPNYSNNFITRFGNKASLMLDEFLFLLHNFISKNNSNLWQFIEYLYNTNPEITVKNQQQNAVRMMSVHSAKGLQAPIVIIPYAVRQEDLKNQDEILWINDQENELFLPIILTTTGYKSYYGKAEKYLQQKLYQEEQENHRLFYVALTRAEEEIYLTGIEKKSAKILQKNKVNWYEMSKSIND